MSGGHFDYQQYRLHDISSQIKELIASNDCQELNDWGDKRGRGYSEETIAELKTAIDILEKDGIYTQRIDWLVSGDDGEKTFHERLKEDLGKATEAELDFIASCCDSLYTELKMQAYTEAQEQAVDKHILDDLVQSVLAIAEPYYKKNL